MLRKLLRNSVKLLFGNAVNAVLVLLTMMITARMTSPSEYGILVFITAFEATISQLFTFNSWMAIVAFGSRAVADTDDASLAQLFKAGLLIDLCCSLLAFIVAVTFADTIVKMLGWPENVAGLLRIYSILLLFRFTSVFSAVFRIEGRFGLMAAGNIAGGGLRFAGVAMTLLWPTDIDGFVWIYLFSAVFGQVIQIVMAFKVIGWQKTRRWYFQSMRGFSQKFPQFYRYLLTTGLHATVKISARELDQLLVAVFLSPAALAVLRVARQIARVLPLIADSFNQTIFPEMSRLYAAGRNGEFVFLLQRSAGFGLFTGLFCMGVFLLTGEQLLILAFSKAYAAAFVPSLIFIAAMAVSLFSLPMQCALLATGRPQVSFKINLVSTIIYLVILLPLTSRFNINGAALAYLVYYLCWSVLMQRQMKNIRTQTDE
jgi:O-antigen/teichoic acid export membrane protein